MTQEEQDALKARHKYRNANKTNMIAFLACAANDVAALLAENGRLKKEAKTSRRQLEKHIKRIERERDAAVADLSRHVTGDDVKTCQLCAKVGLCANYYVQQNSILAASTSNGAGYGRPAVRPVEYRGRRCDGGGWHYGHYVEDFVSGDPCISNRMTGCHVIIPETLGQYTGYVDGEKCKVFDGDILLDYNDGTYEVFWHGPEFSWFVKSRDGLVSLANISKRVHHYNVIGNIHDNPKLLVADNG